MRAVLCKSELALTVSEILAFKHLDLESVCQSHVVHIFAKASFNDKYHNHNRSADQGDLDAIR